MRNFNFEEKYLKITLHDSDFSTTLNLLGSSLEEIFKYHITKNRSWDSYEIKENLSTFTSFIKELFISINKINFAFWYESGITRTMEKFCNEDSDYLNQLEVSICSTSDIPKQNNFEDLYIQIDGNNIGYYFIV